VGGPEAGAAVGVEEGRMPPIFDEPRLHRITARPLRIALEPADLVDDPALPWSTRDTTRAISDHHLTIRSPCDVILD
jgi:hypothetical protein